VSFNARKFFEAYGIEYYEGDYPDKHTRDGWIQTTCPRCGNGSGKLHLGFSEDSGCFVCWSCGFIPTLEAIRRFTGTSWTQAKSIVRQYGGTAKKRRYKKTAKEKDIDCELPKGTLDYFPKLHREYLENRNFDPDDLISLWDLKATGKKGDYAKRIVAPVYYRDTLMSYQGRDVTNRSKLPYKACAEENEKRHHKHCLYGIDLAVGEAVLVVEGITDAWRMGIGAVATFGIKYTEAQVLLLYYHYKRIFVMFDQGEEQAQQQAKELTHRLSVMGKEAENITINKECDPGDLSNEEANFIMRDLLIR